MSLQIATAFAALVMLGGLPDAALAQSTDAPMNMPGMDTPATNKPAADMPDMDMSKPSSSWQIHSQTVLTVISDSQNGPRGGDKTFLAGMTMLMASRALGGNNTLALEAMLSPDPFMGKDGYPLLLQTGETADGTTELIDRQHPHDLFMGLGATVTHRFGDDASAFVNVGYPGEIAFGPTAFMHRASSQSFPTAPITHHWLDSGHITMGVITGGVTKGSIKIEISQFTGREPDEKRFNLDPVHLDSTAVRVTWAMTPDLTVQASWARQVSPEELAPAVNLRKSSLSFEYARDFGARGKLNSTLAFGRKQEEHGTDKPLDAYLFENTWRINAKWTALARFERTHNDELAPGAHWVGKSEIGGMRTFAINDNTSVGVGIVRQFNSVPDALKPAYGNHPNGTVAFVTLKVHAMKM